MELDSCKQLPSTSKPSQAAAAASQAAAIVNQKLVTHLFAALEKLAIAQQSIADTANTSAIESELLSSLPLPEHLRWLVTSEALLQANLAALTRPALLALLKEAGVSALPDRQLVANIVSKAKRERADSEQTTAAELSSTQPQPQRAMVIPSLLTFRIVGSKMESLRLALLRRGWHEQGEEAASSSSSTPPLALKWTRKASECGFNLATADLLINHFPNAQELVTKHGLNRNLRALSRLDQVDTTLVSPPTFYAGDATQLRELIALAEKEEEEGSVWIVKEEGGRRGVGISILDQLHDVLTRCDDLHYRVVVQRYIPNPLLIRERKFDIRLWGLVTSVNPLVWWVYDEYYCRFASMAYHSHEDGGEGTTTNGFAHAAHLTNHCVQRDCEGYGEAVEGNMMSREELRAELLNASGGSGGETAEAKEAALFAEMVRLVDVALRSVSDVIEQRHGSFELFGFDLLIDDTYKPWLLEANASPSMDRDAAPLRKMVDEGLEDLLSVVLALNHEGRNVGDVGEERQRRSAPCWRLASKEGEVRTERELRARRFRKECEAGGVTAAQPNAQAHNRPDLVVREWRKRSAVGVS